MKTAVENYIIKQVRKKRKEHHMTQAELSEKMGLASGFVGKVESKICTAKYNVNHLNELAQIFDCSIRDFFPEKYIKR